MSSLSHTLRHTSIATSHLAVCVGRSSRQLQTNNVQLSIFRSSSPSLVAASRKFRPAPSLSGVGKRGPFLQVRAYSGEDGLNKDGSNSDGWESSLEIDVPADQRPVNELAALKETTLYSWAQLASRPFWIRMGVLWLAFFLLLGGPIAAASFEPSKMPLHFTLAAGAGAFFAVAVLVLRMYLGWSYVGDRLLSAVVAYEETGWYDGQLWVKPPEILARDRLLGAYQVKPVMARLKSALIGSASLLAASAVTLVLIAPRNLDDGFVYVPKSGSAMASDAIRIRDLTKLPDEVQNDDDLAAAAAGAAKGRPVYCRDRFYRALAGGQYCRWSDLQE